MKSLFLFFNKVHIQRERERERERERSLRVVVSNPSMEVFFLFGCDLQRFGEYSLTHRRITLQDAGFRSRGCHRANGS